MDIPNDADLFSYYSQTDEHRLLCEAIADNDILLVRELIPFISNLDERNDDGCTPLHVAIRSQCIEALELLLERGANPYITNAESENVWQSACWNGYLDAVKFFVKRNKNQLYAVNYIGNTGLHIAASNGYTEVVAFLVQEDKKLLNIANRQGNIPLHLACHNGHVETVKFMVPQDRKQLEKVNLLEDTVLHAAVECMELKAVEIVSFLIKEGADLEASNYCSITPLQRAYDKDKRDVIYCILSFMQDDEIYEIQDWLGIDDLEQIVSVFKRDSLFAEELNNILNRFQRLNIVSNSGILAPNAESNTINHYTPSFSHQAQQENNTAENKILNNPDSVTQDNKRPNNSKQKG